MAALDIVKNTLAPAVLSDKAESVDAEGEGRPLKIAGSDVGGKLGSDADSVAGGGSDANSETSKRSMGGSKGAPTRKLSQWSLLKKRLNIRSGATVSGSSGMKGSSQAQGNALLIRTTSKKSIVTNASNNNSMGESVRIENTYQLAPDSQRTFRPLRVQREIEAVLERVLANERYDASRSGFITVCIADAVKDRVKKLGFVRHKLVVQSILSSAGGQCFEIASRCLWNADTDNYTTAVYQNPTLFAIVSVYGLYYE